MRKSYLLVILFVVFFWLTVITAQIWARYNNTIDDPHAFTISQSIRNQPIQTFAIVMFTVASSLLVSAFVLMGKENCASTDTVALSAIVAIFLLVIPFTSLNYSPTVHGSMALILFIMSIVFSFSIDNDNMSHNVVKRRVVLGLFVATFVGLMVAAGFETDNENAMLATSILELSFGVFFTAFLLISV
jgi:hypothetical protein